ncbi:MAG: DUF4476 domain-containing protein [Chitinophagaceae bacterium]|nr:DUF4476 domain-containing protein [Chitinophagaceae bacterium]
MKKLFSLLVLMSFAVTVWAGPWSRAMLRIREERGRAIAITIDGVRQNTISNNLTVNNVIPGVHNIKIFRYNNNGYGYNNGILAYQGTIQVKPGSIYYVTVYDQALDVEENCCLDNYGHWNHNDHWFNAGPVDNWNNNQQWNQYPPHHQHHQNNTWNNYQGLMATGAYNQLINQLRRTPFENSKMALATGATAGVRLSTQQVMGIVQEFSFESTRLKYAKDNFMRVIDPKNYFQITNVLTFQSSKDDLMRFISGSINRPR